MGFDNGWGQILGFSIDLRHRPYNTPALPCECTCICKTCRKLPLKFEGHSLLLEAVTKVTLSHIVYAVSKLLINNTWINHVTWFMQLWPLTCMPLSIYIYIYDA